MLRDSWVFCFIYANMKKYKMTEKTCFHHGKISYDSGLKLEMLDENSLKYYVEELKEELEALKAQLATR